MKTFGSLFSGFGGADLGAKAAGLEIAWGNELEPAIAEVGNANLFNHIRVGNVLEENPHDYDPVDVFHMSPPCTIASAANSSAEVNEDGLKEAPLDIALANKCIEFIEVLRPEIVTLENVWGYRKFQSWKGGKRCEGIQSALHRLGYWLSVEHVNAADVGVPQTRRRMIVRAIRGGFVPYLPQPVRWVGWHESIKDILHTLPESKFADWQLARLPEELKTLLDSENTGMVRPFLAGKNQDKFGDGLRWGHEPAQTIGANEHGSKAFIIDGKNSGNFGNGPTMIDADQPVFTIQASQAKGMPRAFTGARVVAMTPRALARFQAFPDSYELPPSSTLAAKGIGNAVPPLLMRVILEGLKDL